MMQCLLAYLFYFFLCEYVYRSVGVGLCFRILGHGKVKLRAVLVVEELLNEIFMVAFSSKFEVVFLSDELV